MFLYSTYLSILKEISPFSEYSGLMLKLKLQYCGHLIETSPLPSQTPISLFPFPWDTTPSTQ